MDDEEYNPEQDDSTNDPNVKISLTPKSKWRKNTIGSNEGLDPFTCIACNEKLNTQDEYKEHIVTHTTRSPVCPECGNYFGSMLEYENHLDNYTTEYKFDCTHEGRIQF